VQLVVVVALLLLLLMMMFMLPSAPGARTLLHVLLHQVA
jgi:hypothetical protein